MRRPVPPVLLSIFLMIIVCGTCKTDRPLKRELLKIWHEDQDTRKEWGELWKKFGDKSPQVDSIIRVMRIQDSLHLIRITTILDEKGWVGEDKVGKLANNTLFLIIQHSNLKTQQKYLPMMQKAVREGKTEAGWLALLEDRIALDEGRKQTYGSQLYWDKITKKSFVAPLEDPDNVDKRRKSVGLEPLADYLMQWNIIWNSEQYKKELPALEKIYKERNF